MAGLLRAVTAVKRQYVAGMAYRKFKSLWADFKTELGKSDEFAVYAKKLNDFLDNFQLMYSQFVASSDETQRETIQNIYGDCTEILTALIDWIDKAKSKSAGAAAAAFPTESLTLFVEVLHKALAVAELILRDEKSRRRVQDTPALIGQVVSLLDKVDGVEARKVLLQVISNLSASDEKTKLTIGRADGFRKMLSLLVSGDEELTKQILRTLRHFLGAAGAAGAAGGTDVHALLTLAASNVAASTGATASVGTAADGTKPSSGDAASAISSAAPSPASGSAPPDSPTKRPQRQLTPNGGVSASSGGTASPGSTPGGGGLTISVGDGTGKPAEVKKAPVGKFAEIVTSVFGRVFNAARNPTPARPLASRTGSSVVNAAPTGVALWSQIPLPELHAASFPAPSDQLAHVAQRIANEIADSNATASSNSTTPAFASASSAARSNSIAASASTAAATTAGQRNEKQSAASAPASAPSAVGSAAGVAPSTEDILQELMRVQGAVRTLTDTLKQAAVTVQLDLMDTIGRLLFKNKLNQIEFSRIDGYSFILQLLDQLPDIGLDAIAQANAAAAAAAVPVAVSSPSNQSASGNSAHATPNRISPSNATGSTSFSSRWPVASSPASASAASASGTAPAPAAAAASGVLSGADAQLFVTNCFQLILAIILDGNTSKMVGNSDALRWVFTALTQSSQRAVRIQAIQCLEDVISVNPLNVVHILEIGGVEVLLTLFERIVKRFSANTNASGSGTGSGASDATADTMSDLPTTSVAPRTGRVDSPRNSTSTDDDSTDAVSGTRTSSIASSSASRSLAAGGGSSRSLTTAASTSTAAAHDSSSQSAVGTEWSIDATGDATGDAWSNGESFGPRTHQQPPPANTRITHKSKSAAASKSRENSSHRGTTTGADAEPSNPPTVNPMSKSSNNSVSAPPAALNRVPSRDSISKPKAKRNSFRHDRSTLAAADGGDDSPAVGTDADDVLGAAAELDASVSSPTANSSSAATSLARSRDEEWLSVLRRVDRLLKYIVTACGAYAPATQTLIANTYARLVYSLSWRHPTVSTLLLRSLVDLSVHHRLHGLELLPSASAVIAASPLCLDLLRNLTIQLTAITARQRSNGGANGGASANGESPSSSPSASPSASPRTSSAAMPGSHGATPPTGSNAWLAAAESYDIRLAPITPADAAAASASAGAGLTVSTAKSHKRGSHARSSSSPRWTVPGSDETVSVAELTTDQALYTLELLGHVLLPPFTPVASGTGTGSASATFAHPPSHHNLQNLSLGSDIDPLDSSVCALLKVVPTSDAGRRVYSDRLDRFKRTERGFGVLFGLVSPAMPEEVIDLALYLIRRVVAVHHQLVFLRSRRAAEARRIRAQFPGAVASNSPAATSAPVSGAPSNSPPKAVGLSSASAVVALSGDKPAASASASTSTSLLAAAHTPTPVPAASPFPLLNLSPASTAAASTASAADDKKSDSSLASARGSDSKSTPALASPAGVNVSDEIDDKALNELIASGEHNWFRWCLQLLDQPAFPVALRIKIIRTLLLMIQPATHVHPPPPPAAASPATAAAPVVTPTVGDTKTAPAAPSTSLFGTKAAVATPTKADTKAEAKTPAAGTAVASSSTAAVKGESPPLEAAGASAATSVASATAAANAAIASAQSARDSECCDDAYLSWVKSCFREAGGIQLCVKLLSHESAEMAAAAFLILTEAVSNSEENKVFVGDQIGFCQLSDILKRTAIRLTPFVFDVVFDMTTSGVVTTSPSSTASPVVAPASSGGASSTALVVASSASTAATTTGVGSVLIVPPPPVWAVHAVSTTAPATALTAAATPFPFIPTLSMSAPARYWQHTVFADGSILPVPSLAPTIHRMRYPLTLFAAPLPLASELSSAAAAAAAAALGGNTSPTSATTNRAAALAASAQSSAISRSRSEGNLAGMGLTNTASKPRASPTLAPIPTSPHPAHLQLPANTSAPNSPALRHGRSPLDVKHASPYNEESSLSSSTVGATADDLTVRSPVHRRHRSTSFDRKNKRPSIGDSKMLPAAGVSMSSGVMSSSNGNGNGNGGGGGSPAQSSPAFGPKSSAGSSPALSSTSASSQWSSFGGGYVPPNYSRAMTKFRSTDAALAVILLLPHASPQVQVDVIKRLFVLLEANPANKRALCQMHVLPILLRLCPRFHEDVQSSYLHLVAILGLYDIGSKEVRLLFELATVSAAEMAVAEGLSPRRAEELQMQMLWIIGRITERSAPPAYFNFDGVVSASALTLAPLTRFPAPRLGYSIVTWFKVNTFFGAESSLLVWQDHTTASIFELTFAPIPPVPVPVLPPMTPGTGSPASGSLTPAQREAQARAKLAAQQQQKEAVLASPSNGSNGASNGTVNPNHYPPTSRVLAVRTKAGISHFTEYVWAENAEWHHILFTHDRSGAALFVDGRFIQKHTLIMTPAPPPPPPPAATTSGTPATPTPASAAPAVPPAPLDYPMKDVSAKTPVIGHIASMPQRERGAGGVRSSSFSGATATMHLLEGVMDEKQCQAIYNEGTLFTGQFEKQLNISNKRFLGVQPHEWAPKLPAGSDPHTQPSAYHTEPHSAPASNNKLFSLASPPDSPTASGAAGLHTLSGGFDGRVVMSPLLLETSLSSLLPDSKRRKSIAEIDSRLALSVASNPASGKSPLRPSNTGSSPPDSNPRTGSNRSKSPPLTSSERPKSHRNGSSKIRSNKTRAGAGAGGAIATAPLSHQGLMMRDSTRKTGDSGAPGSSEPATLTTPSPALSPAVVVATAATGSGPSSVVLAPSASSASAASVIAFVPPPSGSSTAVVASGASSPSPLSWHMPKVRSSVDVHNTRALCTEIRSVKSGLYMCLPFLLIGPAQQVAALRILHGLLENYRPNLVDFLKANGFQVLGHLLRDPNCELTRESFDVLMDLTSSPSRYNASLSSANAALVSAAASGKRHIRAGPQRTLTNMAGVNLTLDLLRDGTCDFGTRKAALQNLVQVATDPHNLELWRSDAGPGLLTVIELLRVAEERGERQLFDPLLQIFEHIILLAKLKTDELDLLLQWCVVDAEDYRPVLPAASLPPPVITTPNPAPGTVPATGPSLSKTAELPAAGAGGAGVAGAGIHYTAPLLEERIFVLNLLLTAISKRPELAIHVYKNLSGFDVPLLMLRAKSEHIRAEAIRLLGLMFAAAPKYGVAFAKAAMYDVMYVLLVSKHTTPLQSSSSVNSVPAVHHPIPVTRTTLSALEKLALGKYVCQPQPDASEINPSPLSGGKPPLHSSGDIKADAAHKQREHSLSSRVSRSDTVAGGRELIHVDPVRLIFQLLRDVPSAPLHIRYLKKLRALLDGHAENCDKLLEADWYGWGRAYLHALYALQAGAGAAAAGSGSGSGSGSDSRSGMQRAIDSYMRIIQILAVRELTRSYKQSRIGKLKDMVEAPDFQAAFIESIVHYLEQKPLIDPSGASNFLRNLATLYTDVDQIATGPSIVATTAGGAVSHTGGLHPVTLVRLANVINQIASQSSSDVRTKMKDNDLFVMRDQLVLHCIRFDMGAQHRLETFRTWNLEMIAADPKFRESHAILYMLHWLHDTEPDQKVPAPADEKVDVKTAATTATAATTSTGATAPASIASVPTRRQTSRPKRDLRLAATIADILRTQLGQYDENRRAIFKLIGDLHVCSLLFPHIDRDDFSKSGYAACFPSLDPKQMPAPLPATAATAVSVSGAAPPASAAATAATTGSTDDKSKPAGDKVGSTASAVAGSDDKSAREKKGDSARAVVHVPVSAAAAAAAAAAVGLPAPLIGESEDTYPVDDSVEELMEWYFSESQSRRRATIRSRIERAFAPVEKEYRKKLDKVIVARIAAIRKRQEKVQKAALGVYKLAHEQFERIINRVLAKCVKHHSAKFVKYNDARLKRLREGEDGWNKLKVDLILPEPPITVLPPPQPLTIVSPPPSQAGPIAITSATISPTSPPPAPAPAAASHAAPPLTASVSSSPPTSQSGKAKVATATGAATVSPLHTPPTSQRGSIVATAATPLVLDSKTDAGASVTVAVPNAAAGADPTDDKKSDKSTPVTGTPAATPVPAAIANPPAVDSSSSWAASIASLWSRMSSSPATTAAVSTATTAATSSTTATAAAFKPALAPANGLQCVHCGQLFHSRWERICHVRLDHDGATGGPIVPAIAAATAPPLSAPAQPVTAPPSSSSASSSTAILNPLTAGSTSESKAEKKP